MTLSPKAAPACRGCGAAVSSDPKWAPEGLCRPCFDKMVEEYLTKYGPRCFTCESFLRVPAWGGRGLCRSKKLREVKAALNCPGWYRAQYPDPTGGLGSQSKLGPSTTPVSPSPGGEGPGLRAKMPSNGIDTSPPHRYAYSRGPNRPRRKGRTG